MSDDQGINWGGLVKGILAGAAVVAGIALATTGSLSGLGNLLSGMMASTPGGGSSTLPLVIEKIGDVLPRVIGAMIAFTGASYLFSDGSSNQNENAQRHSEHYTEAKESFAAREDMRKMQAVMMARMKAAGHEPAMAMGAQPQV